MIVYNIINVNKTMLFLSSERLNLIQATFVVIVTISLTTYMYLKV